MKGLGYYSSPVGELLVRSVDDKVTDVGFLKEPGIEEHRTEVVERCIRELDEYFYAGRKFFTTDIELIGTDFQKQVWTELMTIPYGSTISYEAVARRLGNVKAIRAVCLANGQNPIAIIVPCHRVIGKSGDLVGYGGGLENKEWLLNHEGSRLRQLSLF